MSKNKLGRRERGGSHGQQTTPTIYQDAIALTVSGARRFCSEPSCRRTPRCLLPASLHPCSPVKKTPNITKQFKITFGGKEQTTTEQAFDAQICCLLPEHRLIPVRRKQKYPISRRFKKITTFGGKSAKTRTAYWRQICANLAISARHQQARANQHPWSQSPNDTCTAVEVSLIFNTR